MIERLIAPYRELDPRVLSVMLCNLIFIGARLAVYAFLSIYFVRDQGLTAAVVGVAFLVENITRAIGSPLAGALSDRIGRVPLLVASPLATALLVPLFLFIRDPLPLFAWGASIGLVSAAFFPVSNALFVDLVPVERRQRAFALNWAGLSLGYTLGIIPAGFLAERDFVLLGLASSGTMLVIPLVVLATLRGARHAAVVAGRGVVAGLTRAFSDRAFTAFAVLAMILPLSLGIISLALPLYAADIGLSTRDIGLILGVEGLLVLVLAVPVNAFLERFGPFRSLPYAAALIVAAYASSAIAPTFAGVLIAAILFSLGEVVFSAALPAAVASFAPAEARGSYLGAWSMAFTLAAGSALFFAGLGRDSVGWSGTWASFIAVTALAGTALAIFRGRLGAASAARAVAADSR